MTARAELSVELAQARILPAYELGRVSVRGGCVWVSAGSVSVVGWLVGLALVCAFECAFVSAFACSYRFVACSRVSCPGLRFWGVLNFLSRSPTVDMSPAIALCRSDCVFRCQDVFARVPVTVT